MFIARDFGLLSFGEEVEEDDGEIVRREGRRGGGEGEGEEREMCY